MKRKVYVLVFMIIGFTLLALAVYYRQFEQILARI